MTTEQSLVSDKTEWLIAALLALAASLVMWIVASHSHGWGDDFAGYIMQGRAIESVSLRNELSLSAHLLSLSDSKFGPPAYPWGYPAMLWLTSKLVGWDLYSLKIVGFIANGVLAASTYFLARHYVTRRASVMVAAFVALQPAVVGSGDSLSSDIPSLAVNVLALLVAESLLRAQPGEGRIRVGRILFAAMVATLTFAVRSNGAFIAVVMFALLAGAWIAATPQRRRVLVGEMALLTVVTSALLFTYLRVVPDGSLAHAGYLTLAPSMLIRRFIETVATSADIAPFSILHVLGIFKPVLVVLLGTVCVAICAIGAWRHRERSIGLVVFAALNFLLLLTFPDNGGPRYLFPMLIPLGVLGAAGIAAIANARSAADITRAGGVPLQGSPFGGVLKWAVVGAIIAGVGLSHPRRIGSPVSGPLTPVADSLFAYISANVPVQSPVSFYKPRALRMFTGRLGIAVTRAENLGNAEFVVFDKREADGKWEKTWQVDRAAIESFQNGKFSRAYENSQFVVYSGRKP